jgi:malonyl-CoA/methylmalonyl-CoA synthetase
VTGEPDDDLGERIIAWVVLTDSSPPSPARDRDQLGAELVDHVAAQLAPHKRPRTVHFLDELPRNDLGKVQKKRLAAPTAASACLPPRAAGKGA